MDQLCAQQLQNDSVEKLMLKPLRSQIVEIKEEDEEGQASEVISKNSDYMRVRLSVKRL